MKKTAIFYSFSSRKTSKIASMILDEFGDTQIATHDPEAIAFETLLAYDNLILGVPTWFDGELPNYWDELVPAIEDMNFKGKTVAIFGNGDQEGYPQNFCDGVGIMAGLMESRGARLAGFTEATGYNFEHSRAERNGKLCGLLLDFENQPKMNSRRVKDWVNQLRKELS
jgi:flavodoxin I